MEESAERCREFLRGCTFGWVWGGMGAPPDPSSTRLPQGLTPLRKWVVTTILLPVKMLTKTPAKPGDI